MKAGKKKVFNVIYGRILMIIVILLIQITILGLAFMWLSEDLPYIYGGFTILTAILVIYILNKNENPSFKLFLQNIYSIKSFMKACREDDFKMTKEDILNYNVLSSEVKMSILNANKVSK